MPVICHTASCRIKGSFRCLFYFFRDLSVRICRFACCLVITKICSSDKLIIVHIVWSFGRGKFSKELLLVTDNNNSPTTVLFRSFLTRTITLYELRILLTSNHLSIKYGMYWHAKKFDIFVSLQQLSAAVPPLPPQHPLNKDNLLWLLHPLSFHTKKSM